MNDADTIAPTGRWYLDSAAGRRCGNTERFATRRLTREAKRDRKCEAKMAAHA